MVDPGIEWSFEPLPPGGARAEVMHDGGSKAAVLLGVDLTGIIGSERHQMMQDKIGVAIIIVRPLPLTVFLVETAIMVYDAPCSLAINDPTCREDLCRILTTSPDCSVEVAFVADGRVIRGQRLDASQATFERLSAGLLLGPSQVSGEEYAGRSAPIRHAGRRVSCSLYRRRAA